MSQIFDYKINLTENASLQHILPRILVVDGNKLKLLKLNPSRLKQQKRLVEETGKPLEDVKDLGIKKKVRFYSKDSKYEALHLAKILKSRLVIQDGVAVFQLIPVNLI